MGHGLAPAAPAENVLLRKRQPHAAWDGQLVTRTAAAAAERQRRTPRCKQQTQRRRQREASSMQEQQQRRRCRANQSSTYLASIG